MAVTDQNPIGGAVGNGVTTVFPFSYYIGDEADLVVQRNGVNATLNVDYVVSGAGNQSGGQIAFVTAPANGVKVTHFRNTSLTRATDYQDGGDLPARTVNLDFDRLWLALQEIFSGGKGAPTAVRVPAGEVIPALGSAASRANRVLAFNADGDPIAIPGVDSGSAAALAVDLADGISASKGLSLASYNPALSYSSGAGKFFNFLFARSAREIAAGVIPSNYAYPLGDLRRYGGVLNGTSDDTQAFYKAAQSNSQVTVIEGVAKITASQTVPSGVTVAGVSRDKSILNFIGVNGLKCDSGSEGICIKDLYILGDNTAGTYGLEVDNNPRGFQASNVKVRRFGTAGNGGGVYMHNNTTFDMWNPGLKSVLVEDCGRGFVLTNVQAAVLDNCIARLNYGHNLFASGCVNLNILGGTYENPTGASAPQYNIYLLSCSLVFLIGPWAENAITRNLFISACDGVTVNGVLLNNITGTGYGNEVSGNSKQIKFVATKLTGVESGETGMLIDSGCKFVDTSGLYGEGLVGALLENRTLNTLVLSAGFTLPGGTDTPTQPVYFISSASAIASDTSFAFLAGRIGDETKIINVGANNITIKNNANVKLNGATDYVMGPNDVLWVAYTGTVWVETARSNN